MASLHMAALHAVATGCGPPAAANGGDFNGRDARCPSEDGTGKSLSFFVICINAILMGVRTNMDRVRTNPKPNEMSQKETNR